MKTSNEINEIAKAMSAAQGEMMPAEKTATNPFFKSRYTNLTSVWDSIKIPLKTNSLTVWQDVVTTDGGISVTTRIVHCSGQWVEFGPLEIPLSRKDAQSIGSAASYGKRYAICAALGVVSDEDCDDGEKAMGRDEKKVEAPKYKEPATKVYPKNIDTNKCQLINDDQQMEISNLFETHGEEFKKDVFDRLKKFGVTDVKMLTPQLYDRVKQRAIEFSSQQKNEVANV